MDTKVLSIFGKVGGIGGLALGVFFLIFLRMDSSQSTALLMVLTFGVAAIGLVAWLISRPEAIQLSTLQLALVISLISIVLVAASYLANTGSNRISSARAVPLDFQQVNTEIE